MKTTKILLASLLLVFALTHPLHAQLGGCDDSPENPTLILAGLASAAFTVSAIRNRIHAKRKQRPH